MCTFVHICSHTHTVAYLLRMRTRTRASIQAVSGIQFGHRAVVPWDRARALPVAAVDFAAIRQRLCHRLS